MNAAPRRAQSGTTAPEDGCAVGALNPGLNPGASRALGEDIAALALVLGLRGARVVHLPAVVFAGHCSNPMNDTCLRPMGCSLCLWWVGEVWQSPQAIANA